MTTQARAYKSILGKRFGLDGYNRPVANGTVIGPKAVDATITIGAESSDARAITIQLKDANGNAVDEATTFEIIMYSDASMTDFVAAGGSTGLAAGASGKLLALVAKKAFLATSTAAGLVAATYTDTGTAAGYLAVRLPNGRVIGGGLVTNA